MRTLALARRNLKEVLRDPLSLGLLIALPALMLLVLQSLDGVDDFYSPTMLAPGIALFGFVMLMFSSSMVMARDRESSLFPRLLTTPLRPVEFITAYSLPFVAVAIVQGLVVYAIAAALGIDMEGSPLLVVLVLMLIVFFFVALGMIAGSRFGVAALSGAYSVVLLLTIFAGTWFDLEEVGGPIEAVENVLPFTHALDATRDVMAEGAGLGTIGTDLAWVTAYTVVAVALALVSFRSRMTE
ncbi:MAG: ABC transporter permease [Ilumatobacter sp.]|uniref:ABC transporter permease n=1 Tax=Ilumatobacter sp. TaxID=1967498 RepID=UPI002605DF7E|nr:ABC transporter permease [Ilumatobacter sp.]MDJ0767937.1 ABC transporter permease [Ilumatobacter sp.]